MPSDQFWKPFLAGALASASMIWLGPKLQLLLVSVNRQRQRQLLAKEEVVMDNPNLDQRMLRKAEGALQKRTSRITIVVERCTNDFNYSAILRTAEALGIQNVWIICPPVSREEQENDDNDTPIVNDNHDPEENSKDNDKNNNKSNKKKVRLATMKGQIISTTQEEAQARSAHHLFARKAVEWLSIREFSSTTECLQELRATQHTVWATDLSQEAVCLTAPDLVRCGGASGCLNNPSTTMSSSSSIRLPRKLAIVFGTEAVGCTREMLEGSDLRVYLPLRGFADSLNLSVATALVLHQLFVLDPTVEGDMEPEERTSLRRQWFGKLVMNRLLTPAQKKQRSRLRNKVRELHALEQRQEQQQQQQQEGSLSSTTIPLQPAQLRKIVEYRPLEQELHELEASLEQQARLVIEPLVQNPPAPLTDMRRADPHRTWFGSKGTRAKYEGIWNDMPATTAYNTTLGFSTTDFVRKQLQAQQQATPTTNTQTKHVPNPTNDQ